MATVPYTLEQARIDVAALRGQVDLLSEALTQNDGAITPNTPAATAYTTYATSGYNKYVSGNDASPYATGVQTADGGAGGQNFTTTTPTPLTGLTCNLGVAAYTYEAWVQIAGTGNTTGNCYMGGTATASDFRCFGMIIGNAVATTFKVQTALGTGTPLSFGIANGTQYIIVLRGHIVTTVAGTLIVYGYSTATGWTTGDDCKLRVWPDV